MKRIILSILLLLTFCAESWALDPAFLMGMVKKGAGACTTPTGDSFYDGFEGCAADGSSGCDTTWSSVESPVYNYTLTGTPPTGACSKGLQTASTGTATYARHDIGSGLTTYWTKFSLYVASHDLANFANTVIFSAGSSSSLPLTGRAGSLQLYNNNGTITVRVSSGDTSSALTVNTGEWHTVEMCLTDGGAAADPCGAGTNGEGWLKLDGGAAATFACIDTAGNDQRYFVFGIATASRTADIVFGNIQVDDDGTY